MEKKKGTTKTKPIAKKTTKKVVKKKSKKKGFTLIELLAVIIILGVLMVIAIPAVTSYIQNSRKSSYVTTAQNIVAGARTKVNDGSLGMYDTDTTYYIPYDMIKGENELKSPYGNFTEAYVVATFNGTNYDYYWTSVDSTNTGMYLTYADSLDNDKIVNDMDSIDTTIGVGNRSKIVVFNNDGTILETKNKQSSISEKGSSSGGGSQTAAEPVSFATDSWATIASAVRNNNTNAYHVGDTKEVDLGSLGTHVVRIANMSTPSECAQNDFSRTACGFVVEFTDIVEMRGMNSTKSNVGGWKDSEIRVYLNDGFYQNLPAELKNVIIDTSVISGTESSSIANYITTDKIYILSSKEVTNNNSNYQDSLSETRQLDYYSNTNTTTSNIAAALKKNAGTNTPWWFRSPGRAFYNYYFTIMYDGGSTHYTSREANQQYGVSPAFRIGKQK